MSKKKNTRGKDPWWRIVKYQGDVAYYARCKCGFHYGCYDVNYAEERPLVTIDTDRLYPYCPICGSKKKWYDDDVKQLDMAPWEDV